MDTQRQLIRKQHAGVTRDRSSNSQHLLLAARQKSDRALQMRSKFGED
jgi:hypothetical protein